ncbi:Mpr protein [Rhodococcus sp. 1168]|nr:Mpr protein [Rhodococcus sp. 1168]
MTNMPVAPTEKKSKKWPWVGIPAVLVAFGVLANLSDPEPKTEAPAQAVVVEDASDSAEAPPAALPGLGAPVRDGKFEFTVTDVESGLSEVGDNPYLVEKAQGQFVIVSISVLNTSAEPKSLSPSAQEMYDAEGRKFSADTSAAIGLDSDVAIWDEINPGNSVTMKVVFDMPVGAVPAEIELHDSMFSGGTRVALR